MSHHIVQGTSIFSTDTTGLIEELVNPEMTMESMEMEIEEDSLDKTNGSSKRPRVRVPAQTGHILSPSLEFMSTLTASLPFCSIISFRMIVYWRSPTNNFPQKRTPCLSTRQAWPTNLTSTLTPRCFEHHIVEGV